MEKNRRDRIDRAARISFVIQEIRMAGISDPKEIAAALNARGIQDLRGGEWTWIEVLRFDKRPKERIEAPKRADWTQR
ncbi:hypothetical protein [Methylobacterium sp. ARG-1]|uniref:hypothetical protein n=1 Tax=Methylobacterium sp. ARG-1 TaxID=1692501 RepID=UPI000B269C5F|nr:hypothetical protein [Methylobacterium sp. ARG-1]